MKKFLLLLSLYITPLAYCNESVDRVIDRSDKGVATVYADSKSAVTTVYNDAKSIAPEIASNIKAIGSELKVGADYVWQTLVRQQTVWSIGFLLLTITSIVNWILFYRRNLKPTITLPKDTVYVTLERDIIGDIPNDKWEKYYSERAEYRNDIRSQATVKGPVGKEQYLAPQINHIDQLEEPAFTTFFKVIHLVVCIALTSLSIYNGPAMLTGFINPQFGAMKDIILFTSTLK